MVVSTCFSALIIVLNLTFFINRHSKFGLGLLAASSIFSFYKALYTPPIMLPVTYSRPIYYYYPVASYPFKPYTTTTTTEKPTTVICTTPTTTTTTTPSTTTVKTTTEYNHPPIILKLPPLYERRYNHKKYYTTPLPYYDGYGEGYHKSYDDHKVLLKIVNKRDYSRKRKTTTPAYEPYEYMEYTTNEVSTEYPTEDEYIPVTANPRLKPYKYKYSKRTTEYSYEPVTTNPKVKSYKYKNHKDMYDSECC